MPASSGMPARPSPSQPSPAQPEQASLGLTQFDEAALSFGWELLFLFGLPASEPCRRAAAAAAVSELAYSSPCFVYTGGQKR